MPAAAVAALQAHLEDLAADSTLDAGERVRDLKRLRDDIESLLGIADRFIGDQQLHEERDAMQHATRMVTLRENADIREELLRRGLATPEQCDDAGFFAHDELDALERDGTLEEAFLGVVDPRKLAAIARKRRRSAGGQFADEFSKLGLPNPTKPKGRGGKALPMGKALPGGGTPNAPGGTSAEATARAKAAAKPGKPQPAAKVAKPQRAAPAQDGPIDVGGDVQKAADLLAQGKKVQLSQPREVSILLDELRARVQAAKEAGENAPNFNLCDITVPGTNLFCAESKGVPRIKMPQLGGKPLPGSPAAAKAGPDGSVDLTDDFRKMLIDNGATVTRETEKASHLRASQMELNGAKVAGMTNAIEGGAEFGQMPVFVSSDNYIVDGHHRWAANVGADTRDNQLGDIEQPVDRVDMDIMELLQAANDYAKDNGIPQAAVGETAEEAAAKAKPTPPASPGTTAPQADPQRKAEVDQAVKAMYRPEEAEPVTQNFESLEALYEAAEAANDEFKALLTEGLPEALGATVPSFEEALETAKTNPSQAQVLMGPMKKKKRSKQKVATNYKGDHNKLKDVIRATILVGDASQLPGALDALRARLEGTGWTIRGAEDKFSDGPPPPWVTGPTSAGYSDTKVFLVSPSGVAAELQMNTNSMFIAKEGEGHKLFEEWRTMKAAIIGRASRHEARTKLKADPDSLPEQGDLYFNTDDEALSEKYGTKIEVQDIPLSLITPVRARPEGIANAKPLMAKAGLGQGDKRDPITLVEQPGGRFKVYDGNSTFAIAQQSGWQNIPAIVVSSDEEAADIEAKAKAAKAAAKGKPAPPQSPGTTEGDYRPTAKELRRMNELNMRQKALYGAAREAGYGTVQGKSGDVVDDPDDQGDVVPWDSGGSGPANVADLTSRADALSEGQSMRVAIEGWPDVRIKREADGFRVRGVKSGRIPTPQSDTFPTAQEAAKAAYRIAFDVDADRSQKDAERSINADRRQGDRDRRRAFAQGVKSGLNVRDAANQAWKDVPGNRG